jgi:hypothetical protein
MRVPHVSRCSRHGAFPKPHAVLGFPLVKRRAFADFHLEHFDRGHASPWKNPSFGFAFRDRRGPRSGPPAFS